MFFPIFSISLPPIPPRLLLHIIWVSFGCAHVLARQNKGNKVLIILMPDFFRSHSSSSFSLLTPNHTSFVPSSPHFLICGITFVSSSLIFHMLLLSLLLSQSISRKKFTFFCPFCDSWNALRILFVLGQRGPIFLYTASIFASGADWFAVEEVVLCSQ